MQEKSEILYEYRYGNACIKVTASACNTSEETEEAKKRLSDVVCGIAKRQLKIKGKYSDMK